MTKHYDDLFKSRAISLYVSLKKEGSVDYKGENIENVKSLCLALDISSYSLYSWLKEDGIVVDGKKTKPKPTKAQIDYDISVEEEEEAVYGEPWNVPQDTDVFGIRFWGFVGKNLRIPSYSRLPLNQLKLKIGLKLIGQSNLVPTIGDS